MVLALLLPVLWVPHDNLRLRYSILRELYV